MLAVAVRTVRVRWLVEGLILHSAGVRILDADAGILNADGNFLSQYVKILVADARFLKLIRNFLGAY